MYIHIYTLRMQKKMPVYVQYTVKLWIRACTSHWFWRSDEICYLIMKRPGKYIGLKECYPPPPPHTHWHTAHGLGFLWFCYPLPPFWCLSRFFGWGCFPYPHPTFKTDATWLVHHPRPANKEKLGPPRFDRLDNSIFLKWSSWCGTKSGRAQSVYKRGLWWHAYRGVQRRWAAKQCPCKNRKLGR